MEISSTARGFYLGQQAYIQDRRSSIGMAAVAMAARELLKEENVQAGVGEILWLTTEARPDVRHKQNVIGGDEGSEVGVAAGGPGLEVPSELWLEADVGTGESGLEERRTEVFTDASFLPGGGLRHGSAAVLWNGGAIAWRSSRQSFPSFGHGGWAKAWRHLWPRLKRRRVTTT